jgi:hypothetical protein
VKNGQEWLGPSYFFISVVLGPLNILVWWEVPLGYIFGLIFVSARTNKRPKRHYHQTGVPNTTYWLEGGVS